MTGIVYFDGTASILIGFILIGTAIWLARETKSLLIGESADPQIVQGIHEIVKDESIVEHVNEILTMHMGPDFILATLSVDFVDSATADAVEEQIAKLDLQIKGCFPKIKRVFIEAEKIVRKRVASV